MKSLQYVIAGGIGLVISMYFINNHPGRGDTIIEESFPIFSSFKDQYRDTGNVNCDDLIASRDSYKIERPDGEEVKVVADVLKYQDVSGERLNFCEYEIYNYQQADVCNEFMVNHVIDDYVIEFVPSKMKTQKYNNEVKQGSKIYFCRIEVGNAIGAMNYSVEVSDQYFSIPKLNALVKKESVDSVVRKPEEFMGTKYHVLNVTTRGEQNLRLIFGDISDANAAKDILVSYSL